MSTPLLLASNLGGVSANDFKGALWAANSWQVAVTHYITTVQLKLYRVGSGLGTLTVAIRACDGAFKPTGADLVSDTMSADSITTDTNGAWYEFDFGTTEILEAATWYAIVCRTTSGDPSNFLQWYRRTEATQHGWRSPDSGSSWTGHMEWEFKEYGLPTVFTLPAINIRARAATGVGFVHDATSITQLGFEWGTVSGGPYGDDVTDTPASVSEGEYQLEMDTPALTPNTTYYYRAKAYHSVEGWKYGQEESFATIDPLPIVNTLPPSAKDDTTATLVGDIEDTGDTAVTKRGFVYGTTSKPDPGNVAPGSSGYDDYEEESPGPYGTGEYSLGVTGLTTNAIYYFRAYAYNSDGYDYGPEIPWVANEVVDFLFPSGNYSAGIRFDSSPGGGYPNPGGGTIPHWKLCRAYDSLWYDYGWWGYVAGEYVYERNYYNDNMYTDLYNLTNPIIRNSGVVKVKWIGYLQKNSYPYAKYKRELRTHSTTYSGSLEDINNNNPHRVCEIFYTNPNTGSAWTIAELDDLIAGVSLGNSGGFGIAACDMVRIIVLWANAAVQTNGATNYLGTTVTLNGEVTEDEADPECEVYFEWGEDTGYGNTTTPEHKAKGETFSANLSGLDADKIYHYRAVIETLCGETFYGNDMIFPQPMYPGIWLGTDPSNRYLKEITDTVLGFRIERGRDEELGHAASGIAELTCDNFDGWHSPERTDGDYYGFLYIGAYLTIIESYLGNTYFRFSGKIDKIVPKPEPDDKTAYVLAIDGMDDLAGTEIETVLRTDTDAPELIGDILDAAGWDAGMRDIGAAVDTLQLGWFHEEFALASIQSLENSVRGLFFVDAEGNAIWQNRHYRLTGDQLVSQLTLDENMIEIMYEWSKRDVKNWARVTGYKYVDPYYGLPEEEWIWYAPANTEAAPFIPANSSITIWASLQGPRKASDALVKGTYWNANKEYDKSGDDLSDSITVTPTYYGQAIKFVIENSSNYGAYMVVPDSPPAGAPDNGTILVYGTIYEELVMTVVEEDSTSQTDHGKRTVSIDARFKSNYVDILSYAQWLISRYKNPIPSPIRVRINPLYDYPTNTLKIHTLTRTISDRVTVISSHLGINQDYYIDKIIHEAQVQEGGWVELTEYWLSRAAGQAEEIFWLLEIAGFSELEETTRLGF